MMTKEQRQEREQLRKQSLSEVDMLQGCTNRMHVCDTEEELERMFNSAILRITEIYRANRQRIAIDKIIKQENQ